METLSLVQDPDLSINDYQKAMEDRLDLLRIHNLDLFPSPPPHPPPFVHVRSESPSSLCSDPFSPSSSSSFSPLSPEGYEQFSIMPSPVRLKALDVLQVG